MLSDSPVSPHRIPYSDLSASQLFRDYVDFKPEIAPFYAGDFRSPSSLESLSAQTLDVHRDRETLASVLLDQNREWGLQERTRKNIELLRDPESVVVITGQQLGLFMSPLYIPYKTLTTLLLAEKLQHDLNRPVVPVFWLAGEDHDFDEVASFSLTGKNDDSHTIKYGASGEGRGPVGRMKLTTEIVDVLDQVERVLPTTPNKRDLLQYLRATYRPGATFQEAFAKMLNRLFRDSGLVVVSIDDRRLKNLCVPLFQREIEYYAEVTAAIHSASRKLEERYHTQVRVNPTNLFLMNDTSRQPIDAGTDTFHLRGNGQTFDPATLKKLIQDQPELFSPNVILRPIVQDFLFPTIAYIGGPGEIAYYAQYKPAYEWAGIPMPIIFPRASITLIEPAIQKAIDRYSLPLPAFKDDGARLFHRYAFEHLELDLDSLFAEPTARIDEAIDILKQAVKPWEASLQKTAGSTRQALLKDLDRFKDQIVKVQKRRLEHDRRRFERIHTHLFPGGNLQERAISPLYFLNRYGLDFFQSLIPEVSLDTTSHQVIRL